MPTRRIGDLPGQIKGQPCRDPEHRPPTMMVYENGIYEHECPSCHKVISFIVNKPVFLARHGIVS